MKKSNIWFKVNEHLKQHAFLSTSFNNGKLNIKSSSISLCGRNPQKPTQEIELSLNELKKGLQNSQSHCGKCQKSLKIIISKLSRDTQLISKSTRLFKQKENTLKIYQISIKDGSETLSFEWDFAIDEMPFKGKLTPEKTSNFLANKLFKLTELAVINSRMSFKPTKPTWIYYNQNGVIKQFSPQVSEILNSSLICLKNGIQTSRSNLRTEIEKGLNSFPI